MAAAAGISTTSAPPNAVVQVQPGMNVQPVVIVDQNGQYVSQNNSGTFGSGSDGAVTFDGSTTVLGLVPLSQVYTMTRDIQCTSITINSGVTIKNASFRIFCAGTVTCNGTITAAGNNAVAGAGGVQQGSGFFGSGRGGGAGGTGVSGTGANGTAAQFGAAGGAGGAGTSGAAGSGGTVTITTTQAQNNVLVTPFPILAGVAGFANGSSAITWGAGGGGGGSDASSNAGGGGGEGGGVIAILAWAVVIGATGTLTAAGGNGANGTGGNAGGGGGGAGGLIAVYTLSAWSQGGTVTAAGGTKGTHAGTGSDGSNGGAGLAVNVLVA